MNIAVLEKKVNSLTLQQQETIESYIDFLVFTNKIEKEKIRKPLDFSKYNTSTHVWNEDAQDFVDRMRSDDRF